VGYHDDGRADQEIGTSSTGQAGRLPEKSATRPTSTNSDGCCYADSWSTVQFNMPNISLQPAKQKLSVDKTVD
jgi:hypothetical protein